MDRLTDRQTDIRMIQQTDKPTYGNFLSVATKKQQKNTSFDKSVEVINSRFYSGRGIDNFKLKLKHFSFLLHY